MTDNRYNFRLVEKKNLRTYEPFVGLSSNTFRFNTAMCRKYELSNSSYVILYFDRDRMAIAFQFIKNFRQDAFKVNYKSNRGTISAIAFFKEEKIDSNDYKGHYSPEIYNDPQIGRMFVICLKQAPGEPMTHDNQQPETQE